MSAQAILPPLSETAVAWLDRPENEDLVDAFTSCLAALHGLATRFTGSTQFVAVADFDEALELLRSAQEALGQAEPYASFVRAGATACLRLRAEADRLGAAASVFEHARALAEEISDVFESVRLLPREPAAAGHVGTERFRAAS